MKVLSITAVVVFAAFVPSAARAQDSTYVKPRYTSNGKYVTGHFRTKPDYTIRNNWSVLGNYNPYTGKPGTVDPYRAKSYTGYTTPRRGYYDAYGVYHSR